MSWARNRSRNEIAKAEEMVAQGATRKGVCYGINLNHRFTPAARAGEAVAERRPPGPSALHQYEHVDQEPGGKLALLPDQSAPPAYRGCDALLLRGCGSGAVLRHHIRPARTIWTTAHFSMRFKNGVVGGLTGCYDIERGHPMERCEVAGTGGRFVIDDMWREATLYPSGNLEKDRLHKPGLWRFSAISKIPLSTASTFSWNRSSAGVRRRDRRHAADGLAAQKVSRRRSIRSNTGTDCQRLPDPQEGVRS